MTIKATYDAAANTVTVTLRGETRTFNNPYLWSDSRGPSITAFNVLSLKYPTGKKLWRGHVELYPQADGTTKVRIRDAGYDTVKRRIASIVGWYETDNTNNSKV